MHQGTFSELAYYGLFERDFAQRRLIKVHVGNTQAGKRHVMGRPDDDHGLNVFINRCIPFSGNGPAVNVSSVRADKHDGI